MDNNSNTKQQCQKQQWRRFSGVDSLTVRHRERPSKRKTVRHRRKLNVRGTSGKSSTEGSSRFELRHPAGGEGDAQQIKHGDSIVLGDHCRMCGKMDTVYGNSEQRERERNKEIGSGIVSVECERGCGTVSVCIYTCNRHTPIEQPRRSWVR